MGEAVKDPNNAAGFAELPDLTGVPPAEILHSTDSVIMQALHRVLEETTHPQTTSGFGSFIA